MTTKGRSGQTDKTMWKTEQKVKTYVEKFHMIEPGDTIVLGISGGADSVCLLKILSKWKESWGISLKAVHVHHQLRGKEADDDEAFVRRLCEGEGIVCQVFHEDVQGIANREKTGLEEAGIFFVVGVGLELHDDVSAGVRTLTRGHSVAVRALGFPFPGLVGAVFLRDDGHLVRDHERRVEAHAELADDVGVGGLVLVERLLELQTAGAADRAEVVFHLVLVHADAVVADGQGAGGLVRLQLDGEIAAAEADVFVGQRQIRQLVDGVGGVGNNFTQEDLLMRINGVDHQIQQALGFCLKLFLCHTCHVLCILALIASEC